MTSSSARKDHGEVAASIHSLAISLRGARGIDAFFDCNSHLSGTEHGHGCQAHEGSTTRAMGGGRSGERITGLLEALQGIAGGDAEIKTAPIRRQIACAVPADITLQWSMGSKACFSTRLCARYSAMEVSSVHSPGARLNLPPPTISCSGVKLPGGTNSTDVPTASPTANPSRQPWKRESHRDNLK